MTTPTFLGRGFSFPLRLNTSGTAPAFSRDEQLVRESIQSILSTKIGERPHKVRDGVPYGTRLYGMLFENADVAGDLAIYDVHRALNTWEPRIVVLDVTATVSRVAQFENASGLIVNVTYRYRANNRVDNFVRPFRLQPVGED